jgi:phosphatidylglycerophosphate synthase
MGLFFPALSGQDISRISDYRYHGLNFSPIDKFILQPIWQFCVDHLIPSWVAPNIITLAGLGFMLLCTGVVFAQSPDLSLAAVSPVAWSLCAICIWMYQQADGIDGKQARATDSSSPLGQLFDHGVDALVTALTAPLICAMLDVRASGLALAISLSGLVAFFGAQWEESKSGSLRLGAISAPVEGLLSLSFASYVLATIPTPNYAKELIDLLPLFLASRLPAAVVLTPVSASFKFLPAAILISQLPASLKVAVAAARKHSRDSWVIEFCVDWFVFTAPCILAYYFLVPSAEAAIPLSVILAVSFCLVQAILLSILFRLLELRRPFASCRPLYTALPVVVLLATHGLPAAALGFATASLFFVAVRISHLVAEQLHIRVFHI